MRGAYFILIILLCRAGARCHSWSRPRERQRKKKKKRGREEATTEDDSGSLEGKEGREEKLAGGAATGLLFSLFHASCTAGVGPEFRDPLWPAFIATTPKGAFIFISIMGHRDVYTARSALSLRSFIIINSATGPPNPYQDSRRGSARPLYLRSYLSREPTLATTHRPMPTMLICLPRFRRLFTTVVSWLDRSAMQIKEYRF